ncbi:MAG: ATP-binding protein [Betaproteobacteria bacterium]
MESEDKHASVERKLTDEKLRTERENTDRALSDTQQSVDEDADQVVRRARENADAVLEVAREKADEQLAGPAPNVSPSDTVAQERAVEDETLREERATADESLDRERRKDASDLSRFLPLEREATDRMLLIERARSDAAVENRDDFLGMVCHDLRDLLSGIVLSSSMLAERASQSDEGKRTLERTETIRRYAARMDRLIGDLVDVASIDAGKLAVVSVKADTASLVAEAADAFQPSAVAKSISLESDGAGPCIEAEFDHDRMLQVLANLITNSIKFTPGGGAIRIFRELAGNGVRFCVSDSGPGIAENMLEAVFERFWQVGKNDRRGLGLGLYISRCIVEAHGGRIWVESELGKGSHFIFQVPLRAKGSAA